MKKSLLHLAVLAACKPRPVDPAPLARNYVTPHPDPAALEWLGQDAKDSLYEDFDRAVFEFLSGKPPVRMGVDMGDGRDCYTTGRWVDGKLQVIEHVQTGPGTPYVSAAYHRGHPAKSLPEHQAHQAMDETAEWTMRGNRLLDAASRRMRDQLEALRTVPSIATYRQALMQGGTAIISGDRVVPESEWRADPHGVESGAYWTGTTPGREWSGIPGDPFIHLERTRTKPLGAEPWDHGAGEAA